MIDIKSIVDPSGLKHVGFYGPTNDTIICTFSWKIRDIIAVYNGSTVLKFMTDTIGMFDNSKCTILNIDDNYQYDFYIDESLATIYYTIKLKSSAAS